MIAIDGCAVVTPLMVEQLAPAEGAPGSDTTRLHNRATAELLSTTRRTNLRDGRLSLRPRPSV